MKIRAIILVILFIVFYLNSVFAETTIKAGVDKTNITTDEIITYKLTITSTERKVPQPELPEFDGFRIVSQVQSSNIALMKKDITTSIVHTYILAPNKIGIIKIDSSKIKIDDEIISSEAFQIEVKEGKIKPEPGEELPLPEDNQEEFTQQPVII